MRRANRHQPWARHGDPGTRCRSGDGLLLLLQPAGDPAHSPPLDFHVSDTYFVVAHFHYVLFGTVVFCMFGGFYFWWPKFTGKMLDERLDMPHLVTTLNQISSVGSFLLGASTFIFLYNVYKTWRYGERVTEDDPWGFGNSLEWATSCPPPRHNFTRMPRIRSERPAFDLHYPNIRSGRTHRERIEASK